MFVGSDAAGERAAIIYKLMESAKFYGFDPQDYLARVRARIAHYASNRVEPLPCNLTAATVKPRGGGLKESCMTTQLSEILNSLETMPQQLERLFHQVPKSALRWEPDSWEGVPGERFCAADQACHIRDIEVDGYQIRIKRIIEESLPLLESFDSYALARDRKYAEQDPLDALARFRVGRVETVKLLRTITGEQLLRRATFGEYGEVTLLGLVRFLCSHDLQHLSCMQWLLGKISSR